MKLSAPKNVTFYIAVVLGVLGLLGAVIPLGFVTTLAFWFVFVGLVVLVAGNVLPNL